MPPYEQDFDFTAIPRLDLSLANDAATEARLLSQLRHALTQVGFLYVENHGVPESLVQSLVGALPELFALPLEEKLEVALVKSPHFLGYSGDGAEMTAGVADRREQFEFATELEATWVPGMPLQERLRGPNPWPSAYPEIKSIVEAYICEMTALGERFLCLVAKALGLSPETFLPFLSDQHRLKLVHYPAVLASAGAQPKPQPQPQPQAKASQVQGVGPHKDSSGWWTFLLQASPPHVKGLQVLNKRGDWIDVPVLPGTFVVNIGQAFEVVTSGVCKATTHRVLGGPLERFSVPFFQGVRRDMTKEEAVGSLAAHFRRAEFLSSDALLDKESEQEARHIDSPFLQGKYNTWGESQLRTKVRSHRDVGRAFYAHVFDKYTTDDDV